MQPQIHIIGLQFSSFTRSVQMCCEEIGLNYSLGPVVDDQTYALGSDALKALHPFGKVPVLLDAGRALFETQAICRYLDNTYNSSRLQPQDPWQKAMVDQWCAAITAYIDKAIVRNYLLEFLFPKGENKTVRMDVVQAAIPEIKNIVRILERQLGEQDYLVNNQFTLADIMLAPIVNYLVSGPNNEALIENSSVLRDYACRLLMRPSAKNVFI